MMKMMTMMVMITVKVNIKAYKKIVSCSSKRHRLRTIKHQLPKTWMVLMSKAIGQEKPVHHQHLNNNSLLLSLWNPAVTRVDHRRTPRPKQTIMLVTWRLSASQRKRSQLVREQPLQTIYQHLSSPKMFQRQLQRSSSPCHKSQITTTHRRKITQGQRLARMELPNLAN